METNVTEAKRPKCPSRSRDRDVLKKRKVYREKRKMY
jgi:hypothetical protein